MARRRQSRLSSSSKTAGSSAVMERMTQVLDRIMTVLEAVAARMGAADSSPATDNAGNDPSRPLSGKAGDLLAGIEKMSPTPGNRASGSRTEPPIDASNASPPQSGPFVPPSREAASQPPGPGSLISETSADPPPTQSTEPRASRETPPGWPQSWDRATAMPVAAIAALGRESSSTPSAGLSQLQGFSADSPTRTNQTEHIKIARDQLTEQKKTNELLEKQTLSDQAVFGP